MSAPELFLIFFYVAVALQPLLTQSHALVFRDDQPRSDPFTGEGLPNAAPGQLSHWTIWNHAGVLEEQAWGPPHLRLPAECPGGFLHSHREPVSAAAMRLDIHKHVFSNSTVPFILSSKSSFYMQQCNSERSHTHSHFTVIFPSLFAFLIHTL